MALKWGILSAGKISSGFVKSVSILPESDHKIVAVAARDLNRAKEFAKTYSIEKAFGDYESLATDPDVEVVYIGCLHPQHFVVSKMMMEHGKHVLCEKPLTMNEKQTRELIEIAKKSGKFLMEAIWSRCFPIYDKLKELLEAGIIGDVKYVCVQFGKKLNHIDRLNEKELGGGTILDLGVYNLQFQQFVFGAQEPASVVASGHLNRWETDESANAIITYPGGKTAVISTHACVDFSNEALIVGEKGTITIPYFWRPTCLVTPTGTITIELPKTDFEELRPGGMSYEAEEVRKCIRAGFLESTKISHKESIQLAKLMDDMRKQIGVVYQEDME